MDNRPIGVFDSGVGGLTAVQELHKILPGEDIVYFGDTGRVPYGSRSRETLRTYASQIIGFLRQQNVKAFVVACGSISSNLAEEVLAEDIPYVTVLDPAARKATQLTVNNRVAIIATAATIRTGMFESRLKNMETLGLSCPLLVPLIENGHIGFMDKITLPALEMYLQPVSDFGADTLILGCTHYPLLSGTIAHILGDKVSLVNTGACAAHEMKALLEEKNLLSGKIGGATVYYVTDSISGFASNAKVFLGEDITNKCIQIGLDIIGGY
jgi:glutamate racemase